MINLNILKLKIIIYDIMLTKILRFTMKISKMNKIDFIPQKMLQIFKINYNQSISPSNKIQLYENYFIQHYIATFNTKQSFNLTEQYHQICQMDKQHDLFQYLLKEFCKKQSLNQHNQIYFDSLISYWCMAYSYILYGKNSRIHQKGYEHILNLIHRVFQHIYLLTPKHQILISILTLCIKFQWIYNQKILIKYGAIKQLFDWYLILPESKQTTCTLLKTISQYTIYALMFEKVDQISHKLEKYITFQNYQDVINHYLQYKCTLCSRRLLNLYWRIYRQGKPHQAKLRLKILIKLIQLRQIGLENFHQFQQQLIQLIKRIKDYQIMKNLFPLLLYLRIWSEQLWKCLFENIINSIKTLGSEKTKKLINLHELYMLFQISVLEKQLISKQLKNSIQKFKQQLKKYGIMNQNFHYINYLNNFKLGEQKITIQKSIADSLRTLREVEVKEQYATQMLTVDIMINNNLVVQVNNEHHYINFLDTKQRIESLKTSFRKYLLQKLGYKVYTIDIIDFKQPCLELSKKICQQIQSTIKSQQKQQ